MQAHWRLGAGNAGLKAVLCVLQIGPRDCFECRAMVDAGGGLVSDQLKCHVTYINVWTFQSTQVLSEWGSVSRTNSRPLISQVTMLTTSCRKLQTKPFQ